MTEDKELAPPEGERRSADRLPDESDWETKVLNRIAARIEELTRQLGESIDTCHFSWEARSLSLLREKLRRALAEKEKQTEASRIVSG